MANVDSEKLTRYLAEQIGFTSTPVDIDTFIEDPYYLGGYYTNIFPFWRKKLRELFPNNVVTTSSYVVFGGAIGLGKSSIAKIILLYDIYKGSLVSDFPKFFQIMAAQGLFVKIINVTTYKAEPIVKELHDVVFGGHVPYFKNAIKYGNFFLNNLKFQACSEKRQIVSDDCFGFLLSEMNELKTDKAKDIMSACENRLWSRFRSGQNLFCHLILDSSAKDTNSVVDDFIENSPTAKDAFVVKATHWESREGLGQYGKHGWFDLYLGDSNYLPHILKEGELELLKLDKDRVMKVPNEYYNTVLGANDEGLRTFIQDVCGVSISGTSRFFSDQQKVRESFKRIQNVPDVVALDFFNKEDTLYDKLTEDIVRLPRDRKLYIGIDCGVSHDIFGFTLAYSDGVERWSELNGGKLDYLKIVVPISIGISRMAGQETAINKIHDFILKLAEDYDIGGVVMDQYQSTSTKQILIQNGIKAEIKSIDRTDDAYMTLKNWIYMGILELPKNKMLENEILQLKRSQQGNRSTIYMDRDGVSHGDIAASLTQVVSYMVNLGPEEVLMEGKYSLDKFADMYTKIAEKRSPRKFGSML